MTLFLVMVFLSSMFLRRKDYSLAFGFGMAALWFLMQNMPTLLVGGN